MTTLNVTEFVRLGRDAGGSPLAAGELNGHVIQNLSFTTTSVQSEAFNDNTHFIRIISDGDVRIEVGPDPTAVGASSILVPAGDVEYFGVPKGRSFKIAAVDAS